MNKKKIILIVIICAILIAIGVLIPILINKKIEKEKQTVLSYTNNLVDIIEKTCTNEEIKTNKYIVDNGKIGELKIDNVPDSGIIELDDECKVTLSVIYGEYTIIKKNNDKVQIVDDYVYLDGTEVYFNPETNSVCDDYNIDNKNGCMKWYIYGDHEKNNQVSLILDHNIILNTNWNSIEDKLNENTSSWIVTPRLITVNEIANIIDVENIDLGSEDNYFFDSKQDRPLKTCYKSNIVDCNYGWLYDNTSSTCKEYGCLNNSEEGTYGYWTSDVNTSNNEKAWRVYFDGRILSTKIKDISSGIRPVIDVQKSILK